MFVCSKLAVFSQLLRLENCQQEPLALALRCNRRRVGREQGTSRTRTRLLRSQRRVGNCRRLDELESFEIHARQVVRHLREGQSARIKLGDGTDIGSIGRLAENVAASYKFRQPVYVLELDLSALLSGPVKAHPVFPFAAVSFGGARSLSPCESQRRA